jgi:hypothetical protein
MKVKIKDAVIPNDSLLRPAGQPRVQAGATPRGDIPIFGGTNTRDTGRFVPRARYIFRCTRESGYLRPSQGRRYPLTLRPAGLRRMSPRASGLIQPG